MPQLATTAHWSELVTHRCRTLQDPDWRVRGAVVVTAVTLASLLVSALITYGCAWLSFSKRLREVELLHQVGGNLIDLPENAGDGWVTSFLERVSHIISADDAWLLLSGGTTQTYAWSSLCALPSFHAEALTRKITRRFPWENDLIYVSLDRRTKPVQVRRYGFGTLLKPKALLFRCTVSENVAILGFTKRAMLRARPELVHALASVFSAMIEAVERQRAERKRLDRQRAAAIGRRMETIGTFATGMAHNLNNVMAAIAGFNAIIELHATSDDAIGRSVVGIDTAVRRAQVIVREVLNFGRRLERTSSSVDVSELLTETAAMMAVSLPDRIHLDAQIPEERWVIDGDFGHLQQVILNICNNAAVAMPDGGTIRWECRHTVIRSNRTASHTVIAPGSYVTIKIMDEGVGMPSSIISQIFEPFFTTSAGGTGLGLSTANDIILKHSGAIDVQSRMGSGSNFTLWLPADAGQYDAARDVKHGGGEVVLVINGDPIQLAADEEIVAALGYDPSGLSRVEEIDDFEGFIDIILISGCSREAITSAQDAVRQTQWTVPTLVAASRNAKASSSDLGYPLDAVELANALAGAAKQNFSRQAVAS